MKTNTLIITILLLVTLAFTGCKKEQGCTDESATNYNPEAEEDDGSCIVPTLADQWVGNYTVEETRTTTASGTVIDTESLSYSISIEATGDNTIRIYNYLSCSSFTGTASANSLVINLGCSITSAIITKAGDNFTYTGIKSPGGVSIAIEGTATRQ